jgi:hypothetical protein
VHSHVYRALAPNRSNSGTTAASSLAECRNDYPAVAKRGTRRSTRVNSADRGFQVGIHRLVRVRPARSTAFSSPSVVPLDSCRTCCGAEVFRVVPRTDEHRTLRNVNGLAVCRSTATDNWSRCHGLRGECGRWSGELSRKCCGPAAAIAAGRSPCTRYDIIGRTTASVTAETCGPDRRACHSRHARRPG